MQAAPKLTRLATRNTFKTITATLELEITPSRTGTIDIDGLAELYGKSPGLLRPAPQMSNVAGLDAQSVCIIHLKQGFALNAQR